MLGHHYQRDEVIQFADVTGDSFKLAREAAARPDAEYIVFCGVHFMAESADILTTDAQRVILPDLAAGCSMADMAALAQVETAWDVLTELGIADATVPVTYMNSSADIKGFVGRNGGVVCTSSNAKRALDWAFEQGEQVLFLPDQHLGRNTAVLEMGFSLDDCVLYDPHKPGGGLTAGAAARRQDDPVAGALLGARPVHAGQRQRRPRAGARGQRAGPPGVPARGGRRRPTTSGSTEYIIKTIEAAPAGSAWAVGTELNLVRRLAPSPPGQAGHVPGPDGLLLLDDEPDRPAAPGLGAGGAGRGPGGQPDHGGSRAPRTTPGWRWTRCSRCLTRHSDRRRRRHDRSATWYAKVAVITD